MLYQSFLADVHTVYCFEKQLKTLHRKGGMVGSKMTEVGTHYDRYLSLGLIDQGVEHLHL